MSRFNFESNVFIFYSDVFVSVCANAMITTYNPLISLGYMAETLQVACMRDGIYLVLRQLHIFMKVFVRNFFFAAIEI
jgi:hypothetical protein